MCCLCVHVSRLMSQTLVWFSLGFAARLVLWFQFYFSLLGVAIVYTQQQTKLSSCLVTCCCHASVMHLSCDVMWCGCTWEADGDGGCLGFQLAAFDVICAQMLQDVQERLVFRTHIYIRQEILNYNPASGDLAYPSKLEMMEVSGCHHAWLIQVWHELVLLDAEWCVRWLGDRCRLHSKILGCVVSPHSVWIRTSYAIFLLSFKRLTDFSPWPLTFQALSDQHSQKQLSLMCL